jgi:hypothetical protein
LRIARLETVDLDSLCIKTQALFLIRQEILHILALIALQLDHLAHLRVGNDGAIAGKLLLDNLEDFLLVELLGEALDRGQGFATIALCWGESALRDHTGCIRGLAKRCQRRRTGRKEGSRGAYVR